MFKPSLPQPEEEKKSSDVLRIVLIGETGVGKSSFGNLILNEEIFKVGFDLCNPGTEESIEHTGTSILGKKVSIIDTQGLNDCYEKDSINCE
jgi:predicted GTPase